MSRRRICLIWLRGRHICPSTAYREARSVAESSKGPSVSKSDRTGRNPGMIRLVRRSSAMSGGTAFFSLVQTFRLRMMTEFTGFKLENPRPHFVRRLFF